MNKKLIIFGISALLICIGLSGCNESDGQSNVDNRFVGTWKAGYLTMTLFSDRTCSSFGASGMWDIKDGKLNLEMYVGASFVYDFYFSEDETVLNLKSQDETDYTAFTKQ